MFFTVTAEAVLVVPAAWGPNIIEVGEMVRAAIPVPPRLTVTGLAPLLTANDRHPEAEPRAVGANVTEKEHDAPAARELPQVLVWVKLPLIARLEIPSATF